MATSIDQYAPVFLPGETPWWRSLAGHSLQCCKELDMTKATLPTQMQDFFFLFYFIFFCLWWLCPMRGAWRWCSCLACGDPGGARCAGTRTAYTPGVMALSVFFRASCSWQSEGLFGLSFSVPLPIQALRGLACLRSFSVDQALQVAP